MNKQTLTILSLKALLRRKQSEIRGLKIALEASKRSRDAYVKRYFDLVRSSMGQGSKPNPTFNPRYQASYDAVKGHLAKYISVFEDGQILNMHVNPHGPKSRLMDYPIAVWKLIKESDSNYDVAFVEEIKLV